MKIRSIEIAELRGTRDGPAIDAFRLIDRADPNDGYGRKVPKPAAPAANGNAVRELYLTIRTDEGIDGFFGPVDAYAVYAVKELLAPMLIGEDPMAGLQLWDKMHKSNRHGRTGYFMVAIGAIDNALWDLRGKALGLPVHKALGGGNRKDVEAYLSTIGFSHDPATIADTAQAIRDRGFKRQKWFMSHGPSTGPEGMAHNVALVANLRKALGEDAEFMCDASLAWDLNYTVQWAERVTEYRPAWIEEPFSLDKMEAWQTLAERISIPVAGGEHLYTRWEVLRFLESGALSVLQPDPEWCGGVTATMQMCALAELFDVPVIPHGHGLRAAVEVVAAQSPTIAPRAEFVERAMLRRYHFEANPPFPVDGRFILSDAPGFGIVIDDAKVEERSTWST